VYGEDGQEEAYRVTAVEDRHGSRIISIGYEASTGQVPPYSVLRVSGSGLDWLADGKAVFDRPITLVKSPNKLGDRWEFKSTAWRDTLAGTVTVGATERVKVPAGKYTAVRVEVALRLNGGPEIRQTRWYAPAVGLVKQVETNGQRTSTIVLKRFEPGKD
jgi:hypothetical protein